MKDQKMNKTNTKTVQDIILEFPVNPWSISPDGRGAYDFHYNGDHVVLLRKSRRAFLLSDLWCGGNVEGECYRRHFCEIDFDEAQEMVIAAAMGEAEAEHADGRYEFQRFGKAPIWLRLAVAEYEVRDAKDDKELAAVIKEQEIG
jgi:hypothetical protein